MIHASADVSADARIGERTQIWDQARVREGAVIGDDCIIGRGAYVDAGVTIGDRVKIQNNALVYHGVLVESGVFIGPAAVLTNDRFPRSITFDGQLASADDWIVSQIRLGEGCSIGAASVVVAGCSIGRYGTVGAGAVVTRDVPDHGLVVGNPARLLGWVCRCGQRLVDDDGAPVTADFNGASHCPRDASRYLVQDRTCHMEEPRVIPLSKPDIGLAEERAVLDVLHSGMLAMGARTRELEEAWAAFCGVKHAVFMSNGTVAQEAILRCLDIGRGDEVITVSFSFNATASAILQAGATPVFVDVREDDFTMDPELVEAAITPRTRAIMPVHLYGLMADMDPLVEIAEKHGLVILEDAAQAIGAAYHGRRAGQFGPAMFSLYATKNVMSGEGGMATADDDGVADRLRTYRNHGMRVRYHHDELGTNFKPNDLAAAIGLAQLAAADERTAQRQANAARLTQGLRGYLTPTAPEGREHVWHQYTMRFPGERDAVADRLSERGIGSLIYYPVPIHRQDYLQRLIPGAADQHLPVTDRLAAEVLSIPVRPNLTEGEIESIIGAVRECATPSSTSVPSKVSAA